MRKIQLISTGKTKDQNLLELEHEYTKRLTDFSLEISELKAHALDSEKEGDELLSFLQKSDLSYDLILLTENGEQFSSLAFSKWLYEKVIASDRKTVFVIGGAAGFAPKIIKQAKAKLSLSNLTFPHEIARLLFVEQLYRASTIKLGHPYHK